MDRLLYILTDELEKATKFADDFFDAREARMRSNQNDDVAYHPLYEAARRAFEASIDAQPAE